jgi:hypothetical protein
MQHKKKTQKCSIPQVHEPLFEYNSETNLNLSLKITISSFEEQEEEMRRYWASIPPLKRLHDLHLLVCMAFGLSADKINNPELSNKINIIPPDEHFL